MNPIRLMAKLTAVGVKLDGGGRGGEVLISAGDVAAALAGVGEGPELVGRAKYCDDGHAQKALVQYLENEFVSMCRRNGWKTQHATGIATLCVFELCWPTKCAHCLGRGSVWIQRPIKNDDGDVVGADDHWVQCGRCKGTGRGVLTDRSRAAVCGITKSRFHETWSERADQLMALVWDMESRCLRHLWRQFADQAA